MEIIEELLKSAEIIIEKKIAKLINTDIPAIVTQVNGEKYKVNLNGADYWIKDGVAISPTVGMSVWVHIPNGNYNHAYICAKK